MFTLATQQFGTWRENHPIRRRFAGKPTGGFVLALSAAALVSWMVFFIIWKVRGDFYLVENSLVPLVEVSATTPGLLSNRPAAISLAITSSAGEASEASLLFDNGRVFRFPSDEKEISRYLDERIDTIEYIAMLTMHAGDAVSRAQIWPDKNLSPQTLNALLKLLANKGFDDFDIAVRVGGKP